MECITVLPQCRRGIDLRAHRAECQASRLIWNDPLSNPDLSIVAWQLPSKRQLAP